MSEQGTGGGDAADTERAMREHEREAREREPEERNPATRPGGGEADADVDVASEPAPPGNVQTGELSGGS
jgi:hypothetical protein